MTTILLRLLCGLLLLSIGTAGVSAFAVPDAVLHFGVGAVAGGVGAVAGYPCDYIKSQMQTEYGKAKYGNGWQAFCEIVLDKENGGGPLQLYKGVGVQVLGIAPEKGIKLGVNDVLAAASWQYMGSFPLWAQVVSGAVSGACQVVASSPVEVLKVGMQTSNMTFAQVWTQVGGMKGMFRGAEACLARDIIWTAICFPLYAYWLQQGVPAFVAGAMSGVVASFAATPPDVIKTRILSQDEWTQRKQQQQLLLPLPAGQLAAATTTAKYEMNIKTGVPQPSSFLFGSNSTSTDTSTVLDSYSDQSSFTRERIKITPSTSPATSVWTVLQNILEREGPAVLFSGVWERCLGAIPRFGTTLAMHDFLEQVIYQAGWLSQSPMS